MQAQAAEHAAAGTDKYRCRCRCRHRQVQVQVQAQADAGTGRCRHRQVQVQAQTQAGADTGRCRYRHRQVGREEGRKGVSPLQGEASQEIPSELRPELYLQVIPRSMQLAMEINNHHIFSHHRNAH